MMVGSKTGPDHHLALFHGAFVVYLAISSHSNNATVFNAGKGKENDCEKCLTSTTTSLSAKRAMIPDLAAG
jgi:hypothetical protein